MPRPLPYPSIESPPTGKIVSRLDTALFQLLWYFPVMGHAMRPRGSRRRDPRNPLMNAPATPYPTRRLAHFLIIRKPDTMFRIGTASWDRCHLQLKSMD